MLCSWDRLNAGLMPAQQGYTVKGDGWAQDQVAGYAFTNVAIFNALTSSTSITDAVYAEVPVTDNCGTSSSAANGLFGRQLHYHAISLCM